MHIAIDEQSFGEAKSSRCVVAGVCKERKVYTKKIDLRVTARWKLPGLCQRRGKSEKIELNSLCVLHVHGKEKVTDICTYMASTGV